MLRHLNIKNSIQPVLVIFAIGRLRHRSKKILSGCKRQPFSLPCRNEGWGQPMLHKGGQNAMTNKRLYLVSWSADIRTSRRRGWCSYIELLSTCHFGLPGDWPLYDYIQKKNACRIHGRIDDFFFCKENKSSVLPRTSPCQARVSVNATHSKKAVFEIFKIL